MKTKVTAPVGNRIYAVANSGKGVLMDVGPADQKIAPSPLELLLMGTAGCTASDVIDILRKKRQKLVGLEVEIDAERAPEPPKVFTKLVIRYVAYGDVEKEALDQAIELSQSKYCSASVMLRRSGAQVEVAVEIRPGEEFGPEKRPPGD